MNSANMILIAFNPKAGAADRRGLLNELKKRLEDAGFETRMVGDLTELERLARRYSEEGQLRLVVTAGGDGTLSAVAQRTSPETCLAVFPLGTENLMAKWLGATLDLDQFVRAVVADESQTIDAAVANGRLALITIGIGFDAEVVRQVHTRRTGHISKWSYAWPILKTICLYQFPQFSITIRDWQAVPLPHETNGRRAANGREDPSQSHQWTAPWVFVANLPVYAGGLSIIPHARSSDGSLDLACLSRAGRVRGLIYALWIALRRHTRCRDYSAFRAKQISITSPIPVGYQLDGDFGGELPLEISVLPGRVRLLTFNRHVVSLSE